MKTTAKFIFSFLAWEGFSLVYNLYNAELVKLFPAPFYVTAIHLGGGLFYLIPQWLLGVRWTQTTGIQKNKIVPVALLHAAGHLCTVILAMKSRPLAPACHLTRSLEPLIIALLSAMIRPQSAHFVLMLALLPLCIGSAIASAPNLSGDDVSWQNFFGPLYYLSAIATLCNSLRTVLALELMRTVKGVPVGADLFATVSIMSFLGTIPFAFILEGPQAATALREVSTSFSVSLATFGGPMLKSAVISGFSFYMFNEVAFIVLASTDAIAASVLGTIRRTVGMLILAGVLGHDLHGRRLIGAALALMSCYGVILARRHFTLDRPKEKTN